MAPSDARDQELERLLTEHFAGEAPELRAPDDLWDRLEGRLGEQDPPRRAFLRGGAAWAPAAAAAAAVLVLAAGSGAWLLSGGGAADEAATVASAPRATASPASAAAAPAAEASPAATAAPAAEAAPAATAAPAPTAAPRAATAPAAAAAAPSPAGAPDAGVAGQPAGREASGAAAEAGASVAAPALPRAGAAQAAAHPPGPGHPPRSPRPGSTTFENYGRLPFVATSVDAISTFSLDADRTSYFLALAWARSGYAVDPDSVRAEEWINAFDYGYAPPGDDRGFAVTSEVARHPLDEGRHLVRIALQAPEVSDDAPLNVTLVLDASGSMARGNRVAIAREAAETIRRSLGDRDRIAVVHFTDDVLDAYTVAHRAPGDDAVVSSIGRLAPHGSTNVQAGLDLGVRLAAAARLERPGADNYLILMSDGVANVDATDPFAILAGAPDPGGAHPLRLITIGVGIENYNDVLLEQLAQHGDGWYRYLDDGAQARETFRRENWLALSTPFADQARAQVTWDPAVVASWRLVGYENRVTPDHTFGQDRREFSELPSATAATVLYEIGLHEGAGVASARLGSLALRWVDPSSGEPRSQGAEVRGDAGASFAGRDRSFRLAAIMGLAADRYSALSPQVGNQEVDRAGIADDLAVLGRELAALRGPAGSSEADEDARFLLDRLIRAAAERAPASGYSR